MATVVIMPKVGISVESCIITKWHKKKGESVKSGELLFSYETDKASVDEEASVDGVLLEVFCGEGDDVPVLSNVCIIGNAGEDISNLVGSAPAKEEPAKVEEDLRKILPPERSSDFCHRLVLFGREYCKARGERCSECPLLDICGSRK